MSYLTIFKSSIRDDAQEQKKLNNNNSCLLIRIFHIRILIYIITFKLQLGAEEAHLFCRNSNGTMIYLLFP